MLRQAAYHLSSAVLQSLAHWSQDALPAGPQNPATPCMLLFVLWLRCWEAARDWREAPLRPPPPRRHQSCLIAPG